ncbi:acidic fibroblast growth factor intracellular-binding protein isoform X2 [Cimex lectularius]|uniref:Acidic fibroblast growth factor intracellular-binding protein n=1 Tax=Cimex lectularius TaxID=79782 RepID=A0A8I6SJM2_CIMLE|nr:acidic fibroblast growth factor intracellular-binding protein isoform X2 [Cimex lectularius]
MGTEFKSYFRFSTKLGSCSVPLSLGDNAAESMWKCLPGVLPGLVPVIGMVPDVDVFISNYTIVDPQVYQLWVDGCTSQDAVDTVHKQVPKHGDNTLELVKSDVSDHYRTYNLLEKLLHNPPKLAEQLHFQIEPLTRQLLIEKYYEFDDPVIRELLGKKLSSRYRKDLDEVSDKTNISVKSCRRQFDNVKRIYKTVEDMQGSLIKNIRHLFLLPEELAKRYGAVVFMANMKVETGKRKLQYLTFNDFYECALAIMHSWTCPAGTSEHEECDLDREFFLDLREIRTLLDKEKELKHLVCSKIKPQLLEKAYQELENNFRTYSRSLITLGCNLHRQRDLKFLFIELVEKCIEPWRQVSWTSNDLTAFLSAFKTCALQLDCLREQDTRAAWERYMSVLACCLLKMYHS